MLILSNTILSHVFFYYQKALSLLGFVFSVILILSSFSFLTDPKLLPAPSQITSQRHFITSSCLSVPPRAIMGTKNKF